MNNWTTLQRNNGTWELMYHTTGTGYTSSDIGVMTLFIAYLNTGFRGDLPDTIVDDLEYIRHTYCNV